MAIEMKTGGLGSVGSVKVMTTSGRGFTVEHWADRCLERIVFVGKDCAPVIRDQAIEYKEAIRTALIYYMKQAIKSDRTTLYNLFTNQGHGDMAEILRKLKE